MMADEIDTKPVLDSIAKRVLSALIPTWVPAPEGSICTKCGSSELERMHVPLGGRYSGHVRCKSCGHLETAMSYLGKTCFKVEPMEDPR